MHLTPTDRALAAGFAGPDPFKSAHDTAPLIAFVVQVKRGKEVVQQFEAMGTSSMAVGVQHEGLCDRERGDYVNVRRVDAERDAWAQRNDRRAMELQLRQQDVDRVIEGRS